MNHNEKMSAGVRTVNEYTNAEGKTIACRIVINAWSIVDKTAKVSIKTYNGDAKNPFNKVNFELGCQVNCYGDAAEKTKIAHICTHYIDILERDLKGNLDEFINVVQDNVLKYLCWTDFEEAINPKPKKEDKLPAPWEIAKPVEQKPVELVAEQKPETVAVNNVDDYKRSLEDALWDLADFILHSNVPITWEVVGSLNRVAQQTYHNPLTDMAKDFESRILAQVMEEHGLKPTKNVVERLADEYNIAV